MSIPSPDAGRPLPPRLQRRAESGKLLPFLLNSHGTINLSAWFRCASERLCSVCGERVDGRLTLVGTSKSLEIGLFTRPPMHRECALYGATLIPDTTQGDEEALFLCSCMRFDLIEASDGIRYFRPEPPVAVEPLAAAVQSRS